MLAPGPTYCDLAPAAAAEEAAALVADLLRGTRTCRRGSICRPHRSLSGRGGKVTRVSLYTRISTDEENQPTSLHSQRERLHSFCPRGAVLFVGDDPPAVALG